MLLGVVTAGCSDDSRDQVAQPEPCEDVCAHIESLCGTRPIGCESACSHLDAAERDCALAAQTCQQANDCSKPEPAEAGAQDDAGAADGGAATDAGPRCSNGYLLGTSSCTSESTVEGCSQTPYGTPITIQVQCQGATPACLESDEGSESTDDNHAGCCPSGTASFDPAVCVVQ